MIHTCVDGLAKGFPATGCSTAQKADTDMDGQTMGANWFLKRKIIFRTRLSTYSHRYRSANYYSFHSVLTSTHFPLTLPHSSTPSLIHSLTHSLTCPLNRPGSRWKKRWGFCRSTTTTSPCGYAHHPMGKIIICVTLWVPGLEILSSSKLPLISTKLSTEQKSINQKN